MGAKAPAKKKRDIKALIASAALPERSVEVCLRPDLFAQLQDLERQLVDAEQERKSVGASLASGSVSRTLAAEMEAVRQQMLAESTTFLLRALPRKQMRALRAEHPARPDNAMDALRGCNIEDVAEALVRRCVVAPELDEADWTALDDLLSDGQWQLLAQAAWAINDADVEVPFLRAASRILQTSADE